MILSRFVGLSVSLIQKVSLLQFWSVKASWRSSLESDTDVKELVPEFYNTSECVGEFLLNGEGLELGSTQDGTEVNDVSLPPWATDSRDFVAKCRAALESPIATAGLPAWIDLLFGVALPFMSQEAEDACNIFYPITYEDNLVDMLEREQEEMMRMAYLSQAYEFGRCPVQAFKERHPRRPDPDAHRQADAKRPESPDAEAAAENAAQAAERRAQAADLVDALADAQSGKQKEPEPEPETTPEPPVREWRGLEGVRVRAAADFRAREQIGEGYERALRGRAMSAQLRSSMRQLESELHQAHLELADREEQRTRDAARHTDECASLARYYSERQRALEQQRWELRVSARLEGMAQQHAGQVQEWEEERQEMQRRLELSENRQLQRVVEMERLKSKVDDLKRRNRRRLASARSRASSTASTVAPSPSIAGIGGAASPGLLAAAAWATPRS